MSDEPIQSRPQTPRLSRFDSMVILVILALVVGIGLTIILGDRVGVQIIRTAPGDAASSTSRVVIQFNEVMDWEQVFSGISSMRQPFSPQNLKMIGEGFYLNDTYPSIVQWGQDLGINQHCEGWYSLIELKNENKTVGVCYNVTLFSQIMLVDREKQTARSLTTDITNSFQSPIVITPDEQWVIYVDGVYGWNGLNAVRITDGKTVNITPAYLHDPYWLPDGRLAATYTVDYDPERRGFVTYDFAVPLPLELS